MSATRKAFLDANGALKCHGFVDRNEDGDMAIDVPDDFRGEPYSLRWNGAEFEPYEKPVPYAERRRNAYNGRGATIEALVIALFEKDAAEIARLEAIRQQVKQEIPANADASARTPQ